MAEQTPLSARIHELAAGRGSYRADAYFFVLEALERALETLGERRHVTGGELLDGVRLLARERFGPLAKDVLNAWGVHATLDIGHVVFHLVEAGLLRKTPEDSLQDFRDVFDFHEAFEVGYFGERT